MKPISQKRNKVLFALTLVLCLGPGLILNADSIYSAESVNKYHQENGVVCEFCHKVKSPFRPAVSVSCTWCHGSPEFMATVTGHLNPNPHNSIHWGPNLECDICHKTHGPSVNYCSTCHHSEFVVP